MIFPALPGSGLAADQTNPQTGNVTFGNWSRANLTAGTAANTYESTFWNTTAVFDSAQYASFSITADAGYHLNLSQLTFDEMRTSGGPTKGRIQMFLNGSATAFDSVDYNPSSSWQSRTFNFTDIVDADNVTTVEFRFYGWNGGTDSASLIFDNVGVTILGVVPKVPAFWPVLLLIGCLIGEGTYRNRRLKRVRLERVSQASGQGPF